MSPHGPEQKGEFNIEQYGEKMPEEAFEMQKQYSGLAEKYAEEKYESNPQQEDLNEFSQYLKPSMKVLDLGCGAGQDSKFLHEIGIDVIGLDISEEMIEQAKKRNPDIEFIVGDFLDIKFADDEFDAVWCSTVFHHIPSKWNNRFIEKIKKILKPNGILYISAGISEKSKEKWVNADWELKSGKVKTKMYNKAMTIERMWVLLERWGFEIIKQRKNDAGDYVFIFARDKEYS